MRHTVGDYMTRPVISIRADATLEQAHTLMREHQVRHLVVRSGGVLEGVVSQRDLFFVESLPGGSMARMQVAEAMSPVPFTVEADTPVWEVARQMALQRYGSCVVLRGDEVQGIFTSTDALVALSELLGRPEVRAALEDAPVHHTLPPPESGATAHT